MLYKYICAIIYLPKYMLFAIIVVVKEEVLFMDRSAGKASTRAKNKYNSTNYDSLRIIVPKGRKSDLQAHVEAKGESINGLVNQLLRGDMGLTEEQWKEKDDVEEE